MRPASDATPVTVAIVSWNTRQLLTRCLDSLAPDVEAGRAQVWVVDNGSSDGSVAAARTAAPWAEVVETDDNLGFGPAVNLVASQTASEWVACANADVELEQGALAALLRAGEDPGVGCVAPRLLLPDGSTQHSVYPLPTIPFTIAFNLGLHHFSKRASDALCLEGHWDPSRRRDVPWAIGAFLLIRRAAFAQLDGFDERQWLYAEDLDLGWRLRDAGWTTRYEPAGRVRHHAGAATRQAFGPDRSAQFMRATYAVIARRRGAQRARITAAVNVLGAAARLGWQVPAALLRPGRRATARSTSGWLSAHRQGLHVGSLLDEGPPVPRAPARI